MLKIVFFDWGGVLCESMLARIERECGLSWTASRRKTIRALNAGETSLVDAMRRITRGTSWSGRWEVLVRITLQHLMSHRRPEVWSIAGVLRRIGLRTAILSNNSVEWACQIGALYNLAMVFEPTIFSAIDSLKTGRRLLKPDGAIYRHALRVARAKPNEALLIDDQPENCEAAKRLGMHAIEFRDPPSLEVDLQAFLLAQKYPLPKAPRGRPRKAHDGCGCVGP